MIARGWRAEVAYLVDCIVRRIDTSHLAVHLTTLKNADYRAEASRLARAAAAAWPSLTHHAWVIEMAGENASDEANDLRAWLGTLRASQRFDLLAQLRAIVVQGFSRQTKEVIWNAIAVQRARWQADVLDEIYQSTKAEALRDPDLEVINYWKHRTFGVQPATIGCLFWCIFGWLGPLFIVIMQPPGSRSMNMLLAPSYIAVPLAFIICKTLKHRARNDIARQLFDSARTAEEKVWSTLRSSFPA